ncbi:MAG: potassium channel family protein [Cyclobacteriaceae bacterium]
MKIIVIGLGNFGSALAQKLTDMGNEVIGVDQLMERVNRMKDFLSHVICLDSTDLQAVNNLPLSETDIVVNCIGKDEGASIITTAVLKRKKVKRIVVRSESEVHNMVMETMGIEEIMHPEDEASGKLAKQLLLKGVVDSFAVTEEYSLIEAMVPPHFQGKKLNDLKLNKKYDVVLLAVLTEKQKSNGVKSNTSKNHELKEMAGSETELQEGDIMVMFGQLRKIEKLLEKEEK